MNKKGLIAGVAVVLAIAVGAVLISQN